MTSQPSSKEQSDLAAHAIHRVHSVRELTDTTFVLRFDRSGMVFEPGQYVTVGLADHRDMREYSVYSGSDQSFLEILVKEVEGGLVSKQLHQCRPGDELSVEGPFGFFTMTPAQRKGRLLFIATGTGISPHHCFAQSYPDLDFHLLHGIRSAAERYDAELYEPSRYTSCIRRDQTGDFHGRVTDYLLDHPADPDVFCYLCGNCDMIYEAFDTLRGQGVPPDHLFAEVYF